MKAGHLLTARCGSRRLSRFHRKAGISASCFVAAAALFAGCGGGEADEGERAATHPQGTEVSKPTKTADIFENHPPPTCPSHSEPFAVTLDAEPGAENVGIMLAAQLGFFEDVGLQVSVGGPKNPRRPVRYVSTGIDDFGLTQQPQLVLAREEGVPVVAIGSVISEPTAAMIWLRGSEIRDIADLEGKTIALPGVPFQEELLAEVLARADLTLSDVVVKHVNYKTVGALLDGRADALFGGSWDIEGAALEAQGAQPVIKRVQSLGVPAYEELVVIVREACARRHPGVMRDFMAAVARGTEAARKRTKQAVRVIAINHGLDPEFSRRNLRAQLEATLPLLSGGAPMDRVRATRLIAWMHEEGIIDREPPVGDMFTNDFLAKP